MTTTTTAPATADPFVELSVSVWSGLRDAVLECAWIADGGDPTATQAERDLAVLRRIEYDRDKIRVGERTIAFFAKKLSVVPPSPADVAAATTLAHQLAKMRDVNVKLAAVTTAATDLLKLYNKT